MQGKKNTLTATSLKGTILISPDIKSSLMLEQPEVLVASTRLEPELMRLAWDHGTETLNQRGEASPRLKIQLGTGLVPTRFKSA